MSSTVTNHSRSVSEEYGAPDYAAGALEAILQIHDAETPPQVLESLMRATSAIGATASMFTVAIPEIGSEPSSFSLFACHPAFAHRHFHVGPSLSHPWLRFARTSTSPGTDQAIQPKQASDAEALALARQYGFTSCLVVPIRPGPDLGKVEMLCLGSSRPDAFEREDARIIRTLARALAEELHEWVSRHLKRHLQLHARIRKSDLELLEMEWQGLTTKEIALRTGMSATSVDSRFQRLNVRMACPNRKESARRAAEYGLLNTT